MEFNSGLSKGSSDDWDSIINFEGKAFEDGVIEGRSDAIESREMLENGIHSGFMKGFAYGLELGFMDSIAVSLIASARCSDNESFIANATVDTMACANTVSDRAEIALSTCQSAPSSSQTDDRHSINDNTFTSGDDEAGADATISFRQLTDVGDGTKSSCNRRTLKRCFEIAARAKAVPNQNIDSFDFDTEVVHLRGLYKLSGTLVGPFRPAKKLQNDTIAAAIPNLSNEW